MWGVTTPCVTTARERLEELGYDVLVFHQTGTGGRSMEELIETGLVDGVLDVTPTELVGEIAGGIWPAGPERLEIAGRLGIPQVVSLGGLDLIAIGPPDPLPERFRRPLDLLHDEVLAATRTTPEESAAARRGHRAQAERRHRAAVRCSCRCAASRCSRFRGASAHDAAADDALFSTGCASSSTRSRVEVHEVECDINDSAFAVAMAERLHELMAG